MPLIWDPLEETNQHFSGNQKLDKKILLEILEDAEEPLRMRELEEQYREIKEGPGVTRRTLRRRLSELAMDDKIRKYGAKRGSAYEVNK